MGVVSFNRIKVIAEKTGQSIDEVKKSFKAKGYTIEGDEDDVIARFGPSRFREPNVRYSSKVNYNTIILPRKTISVIVKSQNTSKIISLVERAKLVVMPEKSFTYLADQSAQSDSVRDFYTAIKHKCRRLQIPNLENEADELIKYIYDVLSNTRKSLLLISNNLKVNAFTKYMKSKDSIVAIMPISWLVNSYIRSGSRSVFESPEGKIIYGSDSVASTNKKNRCVINGVLYKKDMKTGVVTPIKVKGYLNSKDDDKSKLKGAEGSVHAIAGNDLQCVKILAPKLRTDVKRAKILLQCEKYEKLEAYSRHLIQKTSWPRFPVFGDAECENFVGYIMPKFTGMKSLSVVIRSRKNEISVRNRVDMASELAELVTFFHKNNVFLCDMNRNNIFVDDKYHVYMIDLDAAQIADDKYIYNTATKPPDDNLTPPERSEINGNAGVGVPIFNATDDDWILQNIIFTILTGGLSSPYLLFWLDDEHEDEYGEKGKVKYGAYPLPDSTHSENENINNKAKEDKLRVFNRLPMFMKDNFWECFHSDGKYFKRDNRLPAEYWLAQLIRYKMLLMVN